MKTRIRNYCADIPARLKKLIHTNYGTHRGFVRLVLAQLEYILGNVDDFCRFDPTQAKQLVFVCWGNINRSCFADYVARRLGIPASSFGLSTTTGSPAFPTAIATASRHGIRLDEHTATDKCDYHYQEGDWLFVMEIRHARQLVALGFPSNRISLLGHWASPMRLHIHDPHSLSRDYYITCFTLLESAVTNIASLLQANAGAVAEDPESLAS